MIGIQKLERINNKNIKDMADFKDFNKCTKQETECFNSANILEATVATNGYQGGDSGHGSRTYLCLKDLAGTDIDARVSERKIEIMLGGDTELETFIDALRWAADTLEKKGDKGQVPVTLGVTRDRFLSPYELINIDGYER